MITLTYPKHTVDYEDLPEMFDVELDRLMDEIGDNPNPEDLENSKKVLDYYKDQLEQELERIKNQHGDMR